MEDKQASHSKHTKKGMFRGLRQTQQTVDMGSQNNSLDIGSGDTDEKPPDEQSIPMIVEHLAESSAGESDSNELTDDSEVPLTVQDKQDIDKEHTCQAFSGPLPRSTSLQSIKHVCRQDATNTSDEDLSDSAESAVQKRKVLKYLKKIRDKEKEKEKETDSSGNDTDISDLVVTDMDYYSIRHEADKQTKPREFIIEQQDSDPLRELFEHDPQSDKDSDTSDLIVTDKDYYSIRHETDANFLKQKEFDISLPQKGLMSRIQTFDESDCEENWKPATDLPRFKTEEDKDTDEEDIKCEEGDIMTLEEFIEAFTTNYVFKKTNKMKIVSGISFKEEEADSEAHTESLRESPIDLDRYTEGEDDEEFDAEYTSKIDTSDEEKEEDDACITNETSKQVAATVNNNFKAETISLESDDNNISEEEFDNLEDKIQIINLEKEETDEENVSDFEEEPAMINICKSYSLELAINEVSKMTNGVRTTVETSCKTDESTQTMPEDNKDIEEEDLDVNVSPECGKQSFPYFALEKLESPSSRVSTQQKQKMANKRRKNKIRTVETEDL